MSDAPPADSRPRISVGEDRVPRVAGLRCDRCGAAAAFPWPRCPDCGGDARPAEFGPEGTVWSSTVIRIPVPGRTPPYALVYVDLDDGPRVLAHTGSGDAVRIGSRVRLRGADDAGDLLVEVLT